MARGRRKDPDAQQGADVDPLKVAMEKGRAEREAQERVGELRRLLSQAAGFSNPGPTWGVDYTKPVDYEREGLLLPSHEKWPEANEEFSRQWVVLWRQVADAARKAGLVDQIRALEPAASVMRAGPEHIRPLISEMHGLFVRVLDGDAKAAAKVARDLAVLRARCEPTADEMKRGNVLVGRRWDAGKYFSWLRSEMGRWATRPKSVDRGYVTGLVREYCLVNGVPEDVARALVDMMCVLGVLHESNESGVEIPGKLAVTRDRTDQAGAELKRLLHAWITSNPAFSVLGHIVLGTGASGSGSGLASQGSRPQDEIARLREAVKHAREALDEVTYDSTAIIEGMGASVAREAKVVVDAIHARALHDTALAKQRLQNALGQSDHPGAADPRAATKAPSKLTERQRLVLTALAELKAMSREQRKSADDVARRAFGGDDASNAKQPLADLKRLGLVDSVEGRRGGSWLTPAGVEWARANAIVTD